MCVSVLCGSSIHNYHWRHHKFIYFVKPTDVIYITGSGVAAVQRYDVKFFNQWKIGTGRIVRVNAYRQRFLQAASFVFTQCYLV